MTRINLTLLREMQQEQLRVNFDDSDVDDKVSESAIEQLTNEIASTIRTCQTHVLTVKRLALSGGSEKRFRDNLVIAFTAQLQELLLQFRKLHKAYTDRVTRLHGTTSSGDVFAKFKFAAEF